MDIQALIAALMRTPDSDGMVPAPQYGQGVRMRANGVPDMMAPSVYGPYDPYRGIWGAAPPDDPTERVREIYRSGGWRKLAGNG